MVPNDLYDRIAEAADFCKEKGVGNVDIGIILGSGMGDVVNLFDKQTEIAYRDIPYLADAGVQSHKGVMRYSQVEGIGVLIFAGRIHYYEGYEMWQVAMPVRLLKALGANKLITTGACGGLNPAFTMGDIVLIKDHISLMPESPLRGPNDRRLGDRFPDMSNPYPHEMREAIMQAARTTGVDLMEGVYAALPGPSLETKAEYAYLHRIGADLVGMSIVPEVIAAVHGGMTVCGLGVVSNMCYPPEVVVETTIDDVVSAVGAAAGRLGSTLLHAIKTQVQFDT